jgi:predicted dienelactone hydrolase
MIEPEPMHSAGYQVLRIADGDNRPIQLDIWFPAEGAEAPHNYGISKGQVAVGAKVSGENLPVILLSHGTMGAAFNYSWIAEPLARHGYVVLGVSHFGESPVFGAVNPATVSRFGDRTRDFTVALDYLMANAVYAGRIDGARIGLLGHSSGGATVMMLAGGKFSAADMIAYCRSGAVQGDKGCQYPPGDAASAAQQAPVALARPMRAVVAMDPAVGPGFSRESLGAITAPALVIGSTDNDFLPYASHAGRYVDMLPAAERIALNSGEGHFVYIDLCTVPIQALGVSICSDRPGVDRAAVHSRLSKAILAFFDRRLR